MKIHTLINILGVDYVIIIFKAEHFESCTVFLTKVRKALEADARNSTTLDKSKLPANTIRIPTFA